MTREELIERAGRITPPGRQTAREFETQAPALAAELNQRMSARADITTLIGTNNMAMMEDNHRNHARFMTSLLWLYDPRTLVDTVLWVFQAYRSHGFRLTYWPAQLDTWMQLLEERLSPEAYAEVSPIYTYMIINQPAFAALSENTLQQSPRPITEPMGCAQP
ncbi:hypothetical protein [Desulfonatronum lacustre]|uniref:hypothetical protein n=1 Tax=Desulfonatronum lacustre TaxID=66849 RepID=UPI00048E880E|nr:hypothetical protein [Desulfonatronum lacustre]SMP39462.1 hypothetical protein SAMN06295888_101256 [Desulfonatronum zhilinae]